MKRIIAFCLLLAATTPAQAVSFSVAYDGTSASVDLGSDIPVGSSLAGGFSLFVHTTGSAVWQISAPQPELLFWSGFDTNGTGGSSDTTAIFSRNGATVASFAGSDGTPFGPGQYKGANILPADTLPLGLLFDAVLVNILTAGNGVVKSTVDVLGGNPFFRHGSFAFLTEAPLAATPIPGALALFLTGLVGLGWLGRQRVRGAS